MAGRALGVLDEHVVAQVRCSSVNLFAQTALQRTLMRLLLFWWSLFRLLLRLSRRDCCRGARRPEATAVWPARVVDQELRELPAKPKDNVVVRGFSDAPVIGKTLLEPAVVAPCFSLGASKIDAHDATAVVESQ